MPPAPPQPKNANSTVIPIRVFGTSTEPAAAPVVSDPCGSCHSRTYSLCACLAPGRLENLAQTVTRTRLRAHETLFERGEKAEFVYTVTSGALKLYSLLPDGRRQIVGFPYPGDFLNVGPQESHLFSCEAVTETTLCRFTHSEYAAFLENYRELKQALVERTGDELQLAQMQMTVLGRKTASERVASFLLQLLNKRSQLSANVVHLPMTRTDIADYLGLTTETVSRTFSQFRRDGLINLTISERVGLTNIAALSQLAAGLRS